MKRFKGLISLALALCFAASIEVSAGTDERGVWTGISSGVPLPKITAGTARSRNTHQMDYSEVVFLEGYPQISKGLLTVSQSGGPTADRGTYTVTYRLEPYVEESEAIITRNMAFRVNYRKVTDAGVEQIILDYEVSRWSETIDTGNEVYNLIPNMAAGGQGIPVSRRSRFGRSIVTDITPGVNYYKGHSSVTSVYTAGDGQSVAATVTQSGTIYGYGSPWSKTETERINLIVESGSGTAGWQMEAQVRPSVSVNKVLQYSPNEPTAISFRGAYYEVTQNQSVLSYNIYQRPIQHLRHPASGAVNLPNINDFEMLPAPQLGHIRGHFAESDIRKLFALQILDGEPGQFRPEQAMTRAQFVTALVRAFDLPVEYPTARGQRNRVVTILFPDVQSNRSDFHYIMAAFNTGLVHGRHNTQQDSRFRPDEPITREEAVVLMVRGLGLEHLGLTPTTVTPFVDNADIGAWARREVSAALSIGLVDMDTEGRFNPGTRLSKAEGAAYINHVIEYMRTGLPVDYVENILNYAD
jgi:hypothetical protein